MRVRRRRREPAPDDHPGLLEVRGVRASLGGVEVLGGVDLVVAPGELVCLVGPNGAGKSTLLAVVSGDLVPTVGDVLLDGRSLERWDPGVLARRRAVLPQQVTVGFPFTVGEVVAMGRSPWAEVDGADRRRDEVVREALVDVDVAHLADRPFPRLSGGERARAALARVLAQEAQLLLLDEPTSALDVHHTELVLAAVRRRVTDGGAAVVVLHDLLLAAAHADRVVVVAGGAIAADGPPGDVLRPDLLSAVYGHPIDVVRHPVTGGPLVLPRHADLAG